MISCDVCAHDCQLKEGEIGKCQVRQNICSKIEPLYYGQCSRIALEPIEKRPFFHFYPGSKFLSVGLLGCSFSCNFCQNYKVSQSTKARTKNLSPEELVQIALDKKMKGIAWTYNEPTVHYEYLLDVGMHLLLKDIPLKMAIKSNGFASKTVVRNLSLFGTAWNIDIKGDESEYERVMDGSLDPVLQCIEWLVEIGAHVEISHLVLPRQLKDKKYHRFIRNFLASLSTTIPVHILYFYPFHKMKSESYEAEELLEVVNLFKIKMRHVYVSNAHNKPLVKHRNTTCSKCNKVMISRVRKPKVMRYECCGKTISGLKT